MNDRTLTRVLAAGAAVLGLTVPATQMASATPAVERVVPSTIHIMRPHHGTAAAAAAPAGPPLTYQTAGAPVQQHANIYLVFWGTQWKSIGWTDTTVHGEHIYNTTVINYVTKFTRYLADTNRPAEQVQYCSGVAAGTVDCGGAGVHVSLPLVFAGSWIDDSSLPPPLPVTPDCFAGCVGLNGTPVTTDQLGAEALRAQTHFLGGGNDLNANFVIFLPKGAVTPGFGEYCAYHTSEKDAAGRDLVYTNMPYLAPIPTVSDPSPLGLFTASCGQNWVNPTDNSFGNGYLDGYSMVELHEVAEAMTDPLPGVATAWLDSNGQENGDKCEFMPPSMGGPGAAHNIGADPNGHYFAVQTLWSNLDGGCILH